jgi:hypothetical protein
VRKEPKNTSGLWEFITGHATRYLLVKNGNFYSLAHLTDDKYKVKSQRELSQLFKVFNNKREPELRLAFYNRKMAALTLPIHKTLEVKNKNPFLSHLRSELNKIQFDFDFNM